MPLTVITLRDRITIPKVGDGAVTGQALEVIRQHWTLQNPMFDHHRGMVAREKGEQERAEEEGRSFRSRFAYRTAPDEVVRAYWECEECIQVPRGGGLGELRSILQGFGYEVVVEDRRVRGLPIDARLSEDWEPRDYQIAAVDALLAQQRGYVESGTGSGKSVMGLLLIARLKVVTLVVAHTTEILDTWTDEILGNEERATTPRLLGNFRVTRLQGSAGALKAAREGDIILATVQTLYRANFDVLTTLCERVGLVIGDEAHHSPAMTFWEAFNGTAAKHRHGFTATPKRKDEMHFLLDLVMGPCAYKVPEEMLVATGAILRPEIQFIATNFYPYVPDRTGEIEVPNVVAAREIADSSYNRVELIRQMTESAERNTQIADKIEADWKAGHVCAVLTERVEHAATMRDLLVARGMVAEMHVGKVPKTKRREIVRGVVSGRIDAIVGTSVLDEGVNIPNLSALHLTCPSNNEGRLMQQVGRIRRPKKNGLVPVVRDYIDVRCKAVMNSWHSRKRWYRKRNFKTLDFDALPAILGS